MTTLDERSSLIAKLEAATEGSFDLSWEIAQHLGWTKYWYMTTIYLPPGEIENDPRQEDENWRSGAMAHLPEFTTSIDAALALVPKGMLWGVSTFEHEGRLRAGAHLMQGGTMYQRNDAWTAPLAICIAALKAREEAATRR
jgi:hypothetical protein